MPDPVSSACRCGRQCRSGDLCADAEFAKRLVDRDRHAWNEFGTRYERLARCVIRRTLGRFANAGQADYEDAYSLFIFGLIANDMHKLRMFMPSRGVRFSSWLGMLATQASWDQLRLQQRAARLSALMSREPHHHGADAFTVLASSETWSEAEEALAQLTRADRTFVRRLYEDEIGPEALAGELKISKNTVYSRKHKITKKLRACARGGVTRSSSTSDDGTKTMPTGRLPSVRMMPGQAPP